jgi:hypothetical protein
LTGKREIEQNKTIVCSANEAPVCSLIPFSG